ncbi:arabinosyltransferase domain-containing protein [Mycobacteroides abscessus]|uniref:arabinosyltransferase domain-containing protein n=1 Tax=Mycobacteroides abscessus TaxID=36809 RepID=UPI002105F629|nr:arabinosyltransferase domain-containing protein [Mycobacteroides abscessus]
MTTDEPLARRGDSTAGNATEKVAGNGDGEYRRARLLAIVTGFLGALLAVATPLLPVRQDTAQLNWPQNNTLASVDAPLIGYVPTDLTITVPCAAAKGLDAHNNVLLSTVPKQAPNAVDRGMLIQRSGGDLVVIVRNVLVVSAPFSEVLGPNCQRLEVSAHSDKVTGEFVGLTQGPKDAKPGQPRAGERGGYDFRPQIVGIFTDLSGPAPEGLKLSATVDTRYSSSPTVAKFIAMILGVLLTAISLVALHTLDTADGRRHKRFMPEGWWKPRPLDALVGAVLVWWHFVGANTSDDGYILTMARVAEGSGYMANYYRWFGTPESPFGWYYDLLTIWAHVSTASVWMRLPTLAMGLLCWAVISREVIPRLGHAARTNPVVPWTAAAMFLAFWLPFNNGLRPEPIIALGILLTWCSVERSIATNRLLPAAAACIIGALTLFSGPTGIASIGALLVAIGPLRTIVSKRAKRFGYAALLAPILAAGLVTLIVIFRDQTLVGEIQANALKSAVGPSLNWFDEHVRYERLFLPTTDGAISRRFPVLALVIALGVAVAMTLRKNKIPGTASGPSRRIIGITLISFVAIMFTPTKWTHHFGVFAGLAGSLGALAAVAVTAAAMRSPRNRTLYAAIVLFVLSLSFSSVNGWWYVSNFGVPWSNSFPQWHFGISTVFFGLSALAILIAAWMHFTGRDHPGRTPVHPVLARLAESPLAVGTWIVVVWSIFSLTAGMINQYPAWSVGRSNLDALRGNGCGLANDVMVEEDPNAGMLQPIDAPIGQALAADTNIMFDPNGIPSDVSADEENNPQGSDSFVERDKSGNANGSQDTEGGTTIAAGVNGSRARLPFDLKPETTPVMGSYQVGPQRSARLLSSWYRLPPKDATKPLLVLAAAGRFDPVELQVQFAGEDGKVLGAISFADLGPSPAWRNLRMSRDAIPTQATRIRLLVTDDDLAPQHWVAITPPRVPSLRSLQAVVGSDPVFLDWLVGLAFPCQRPFGHKNGVIEIPKWRILPDRFGAEANSPVMDYLGGGPLGITELLLKATPVPTYLQNDWFRDWGALQRFTPYYRNATEAQLQLGTAVHSGLWTPGPLRKSR